MTVLKGKDVYSAISISDNKLAYKAGSRMEGQHYHIGSWGARGFTCSTDIKKLWDAGEIAELTVSETSYVRTDSNTGAETTVQSAVINGYITRAKEKKLIMAEAETEVTTVKAEIMVKNARVVAMKELNLDEASMKELLKAVGA